MIRSAARRVAVFVLATAFAAPAARAQGNAVGWTYTIKVTMDSGGGHATVIASHYQVTDRSMRLEVESSAAPQLSGAFILMNTGDSTMTTVLPSQGMAMVMSPGGMPFSPMSRVKHELKDLTQGAMENLGPGDPIGGHATRHYRMTQALTVVYTIGDQSCSRSHEVATEFWIAPDVDVWPVVQSTNRRVLALGAGGSGSPLDSLIMNPPQMPAGSPLRTISTWTDGGKDAKATAISYTSELVDFTHTPIDTSRFAVPAGYQVQDMRVLMASMPAGSMDEMMSTANAAMMKSLCGK